MNTEMTAKEKFILAREHLQDILVYAPRFDYLMDISKNGYDALKHRGGGDVFDGGYCPIRIYRDATLEQQDKVWSFREPQIIKEAEWFRRFIDENYSNVIFSSSKEKIQTFREFEVDLRARIICSLWLKGFEEYHPLDIFREFCLESATLFVRAESMFRKELLEQITLFFEAGGITGNQFVAMSRQEQTEYTKTHYHKIFSWLWKRTHYHPRG